MSFHEYVHVHSPGMDMFAVCVGAEQFVCMLDDENIIEMHHKMRHTLHYTVRSVWKAQGIFISLCIEIDAYFIWYFSWDYSLKQSSKSAGTFCLPTKYEEADWYELK